MLFLIAGIASAHHDHDDNHDHDHDGSRVSWDPERVEVTAAPGTSHTIKVTLQPHHELHDTDELHIVAEGAAAAVTKVNQPTFPRKLKPHTRISFSLTISVPAKAPSGSVHGELVLVRSEKKKEREVKGAEALPIVVLVDRAPIADAGRAKQASVGSVVRLDGSKSNDPEKDALTYRWRFTSVPAGSAASLLGATTAQPQFTPDKAGTYVASLTVNDGHFDSAADPVQIKVTSSPRQFLQDLEKKGEYPILDRSRDLRGPDADANGIRDDVFAYLRTLSATAAQRPAMEQLARSMQATMLIDTSDDAAVQTTIAGMARAVDCLGTRFPDITQRGAMLTAIEKVTANTRERSMQYIKFSQALSGSVLTLPSQGTCDQ